MTGLKSRAMTSPDGKIRIPLNESADDKSQIAEYLEVYKGEGIQHLALSTDDIYATVEALRAQRHRLRRGAARLLLRDAGRAPARPRRAGGAHEVARHPRRRLPGAAGCCCRYSPATLIGPIFFEIIQRKGDEGFGEGNFKALFESMERDQIRRGVLKDG